MTNQHILDALYATVAARKGADPETSYTAKLFAKGTAKIAQKVGEEGVETVIAALAETPEKVASESADLLYHLTVLWADQGSRLMMSGRSWPSVRAFQVLPKRRRAAKIKA